MARCPHCNEEIENIDVRHGLIGTEFGEFSIADADIEDFEISINWHDSETEFDDDGQSYQCPSCANNFSYSQVQEIIYEAQTETPTERVTLDTSRIEEIIRRQNNSVEPEETISELTGSLRQQGNHRRFRDTDSNSTECPKCNHVSNRDMQPNQICPKCSHEYEYMHN